ncbi:MAG: DUF4386 family protein [Actinomycetota bacterium]
MFNEPGPHHVSDKMFRRVAGVSTLLAVVIGGVSGYLFLAAGAFRPGVLLEPAELLELGASAASLLRWGALTDMFGYYLLLVPLFLAVGTVLRRHRGPLVDLFTVGGLMYVVIGALGAVVLATAAPPLMEAYESAGPAARPGTALAFATLVDAIYKGAWQTLQVIPGGVWLIGTGVLLGGRRPVLGAIGVSAGLAGLAWSALRMLEVDLLGATAVGFFALVGVLFAAYIVWLALLLVRDSDL